MYQLKPWQEKTVEFNLKNPYAINRLGCGLGKSLAALHTAFETTSRPLVVVPTYLKENWVNEVKKFFPNKIVTVINKAKDIYKVWDTDIVIVSYGMIDKCLPLFEWADMVIADEAHYLKTMNAKRTEEFHRLLFEQSPKRALFLTGTPILNKVYEFYSLLCLCNYNPKILESRFLLRFPTYVDFADYFSYRQEKTIKTARSLREIVDWSGLREDRLDELMSWFKGILINFDSSILGATDRIEKDVIMSSISTPELWEAFEQFNSEFSSVQSPVKRDIAIKKADFTSEYVSDLLEEVGKVVVFTDHPEAGRKIAEKFRVTCIDGTVLPNNRARIVNNFVEGETDVIVGTYGAFSTGNNLVVANHMVLNDPPWVPGVLEQAKFRIDRIGQTRGCVYHNILGSIQDGYIYQRLQEKSEVIDKVLGEYKNE